MPLAIAATLFLKAGCPSRCDINSIKALMAIHVGLTTALSYINDTHPKLSKTSIQIIQLCSFAILHIETVFKQFQYLNCMSSD